jgi:RecB family exonuclease
MNDFDIIDRGNEPSGIVYGNAHNLPAPIPRVRDVRLSYSTNSTFESCMRKFELSRMFHQPEKGLWEDNHAADVGTCLHHGYQHYVATHDADRSFFEMARKYPHESSKGWDDSRSFETATGVLELMIEKAEMHEFELAMIRDPNSGLVIPATEISFEIEFVCENPNVPLLATGGRLTFVGFIDLIEVSRFTGRHRVCDIKTHQSKIVDRNPNYKFNTQQVPYGIVLEHILGRQIDAFDVDYLDCFVDLANPRVEHYPYLKTQTDIQEWIAARVIQIRRLNEAIRGEFFPRVENGCLSFNRPCRFMDVCETRDPNAVQAYLLMGEDPAPFKPFEPVIRVQLAIPEGMV